MSFKNIPNVLTLGLVALISALVPTGLHALDIAESVKAPGLETLSSVEVVHDMGLGWNLGNTMECAGDWIKGGTVHNYETAWGNPETTREMIDAIKKAGFKSVRIPVEI